MKKMYGLPLLCLFLSLCAPAQELLFKMKITDVDTMMVLLRTADRTDTLHTTNGSFTFRTHLPYPQLFTAVCVKNEQSIRALKEGNERKMRSITDGVSREFFFENGDASLTSTFAGFGAAQLARTTHSVQDRYDEFRKRFNPLVKMARTIIDSSYSPGKLEGEKKAFTLLYNRINEIENETAEKFVLENTNNAAGAYVLYRYCRIENASRLDSIYRLFNPQLQSTAYLTNIHDKIKALLALKPGKETPAFEALTHTNQKIRLADFTNKYVVLDFWGSWCMPCISGFPKMKEYYAKYKDTIEFIGIACNDKDDAWREAIRKHKLPWVQVFNTTGLEVQYNVEAYPTKILIDKNGKFIQSFTGEGDDFYKKLDALPLNF